MSIPTRDELIERAKQAGFRGLPEYPELEEYVADFALAEIRRAVCEELEALRDDMAWDAVVFARISRRLAALHEQQLQPMPPRAALWVELRVQDDTKETK